VPVRSVETFPVTEVKRGKVEATTMGQNGFIVLKVPPDGVDVYRSQQGNFILGEINRMKGVLHIGDCDRST